MTATTTTISPALTETRTTPLWRTSLIVGIAAAVATTAVAAAALSADVPLEIDGEQIPLVGFAQVTLMCTAIGLLIAKALSRWASKPKSTFTMTTIALTALSFVPDLTASATTATKIALITTHVVAAAIVIPNLARQLSEQR